jgi:peroxiredoxin
MEGPLADRLAAHVAASKAITPDFVEPEEALVARLRENGAGAAAPDVGEPMPPFALPDAGARLVTLASLLAEGPAAVVLDRGHWCPYCRISTAALARAERAIRDRGGRLVAIVPERQTYAQQLRAQARASFPILSDMDNGYALTLGLAFWIGADLQRLYFSVGNRMPDFHGNFAWMLPIPATFVVGSDRSVKARFVEPDYRQRMAIDDLIAAVGAAGRA